MFFSTAFSINGQPTIISKSDLDEILGQRTGLSDIDVNQLKKYYNCPGSGVKTIKTTTTTTTTTTAILKTTPRKATKKPLSGKINRGGVA